MLKSFLFCTFLLISSLNLLAQKISNQVINSSGGVGITGNLIFTYAVGEPITTTIGDNKNAATQGFLQPDIRINTKVFIQELGTDCDFTIFPNPTADRIYSKQDMKDLTFDIFNDVGQLMGRFKTDSNNAIDVSNFAVGHYFIRLACDETHSKIVKFIKF